MRKFKYYALVREHIRKTLPVLYMKRVKTEYYVHDRNTGSYYVLCNR